MALGFYFAPATPMNAQQYEQACAEVEQTCATSFANR